MESDSGEEWFDEEEIAEENISVTCLFCSESFTEISDLWSHCRSLHEFCISSMKEKLGLDFYGFIKLVNFQRKMRHSSEEFLAICEQLPWNKEEYMIPTLEDDPLLQFDFEGMEGTVVSEDKCGGEIAMSKYDHQQLLHRLKSAEDKVQESENELQNTRTELQELRSRVQEVLLSSSSVVGEQKSETTHDGPPDSHYFSSYSHYGIHMEMLQDTVRTKSYQDAINTNSEIFKDKVVLDVGCGTGILSMMAARAGAKQVIGIDMSDIIYQAMDIVRENGLQDKITLMKGCVEQVDLPVDEVDIIISEWMGYFLLFESMLDTVLYARDRWLNPHGVVLPNKCTISVVGIDDPKLHSDNLGFWSDVYGFSMNCMRQPVLQEALVKIVKPDTITTTKCVIKELDVSVCKISDLDFSSSFTLKATRSTELSAIVGYFDIWFGPKVVHFSTSPENKATHWKQTVFLLDKPIKLEQDEELSGHLICRKCKKDPRSLKISITIKGKIATYYMD